MKKYAMVFLWDAIPNGGSLNQVVDKILLYDTQEEAEKDLNKNWEEYFEEKVEIIKNIYGKNAITEANIKTGVINYTTDMNKHTVSSYDAYAVIIKEIEN